MRDFAHPRLWLAVWIAGLAGTVAVCLLPAPYMAQTPSGTDKVVHAAGYALLAVWAVWLFATRRAQWRAVAGLVALGVAIEILQGSLVPETRSMDARDVVANTLGALAGACVRFTPLAGLLQQVDRLLAR
ncbi:VanZ family protein [Coralloluteibacterium stylophorae]|uniref:VanZ family protein n=1 Tax=Coralloluteibacterium stylophorae TaxID=1776034 RepID=A0A8J7VRZ2_9GAMM|nr:VanZ family protein [Coralloluteibacterium stylophorae]MBS7458044.1 VanZ family protein [Coralloluteibacterium stylophorae]